MIRKLRIQIVFSISIVTTAFVILFYPPPIYPPRETWKTLVIPT